MFKKTAIILGIVCVVALGFWVAFTWGVVGEGGYETIDKSYTASLDSDGSLVIDGDAEITVERGASFSIRCVAQIAKQRSELVSFDHETAGKEHIFTLRDGRGAHINVGERATITVVVPEDFEGSLAASSGVGQCNITGLQLTALDINCETGRVALKQVSAQEVRVQQDTGAFSGQELLADNVDIRNDTGEVRVENSKIGSLKTDMDTGLMTAEASIIDNWTHSGSTGAVAATGLTANDGAYGIAVDTGSIDLEFVEISSGVVAQTDTGRARVAIPAGVVVDATLDSDIGGQDISVEQGNGGLPIEMYSDVGSLTLEYAG
ncbi:MAG: DUF4097 family beta strand repeat-containing protein [Christensenellales bacterium]|jgi:hypothetical protein